MDRPVQCATLTCVTVRITKLRLQAQTPTLEYTDELLYLLANVSSLVNAKWYLGIPFNDTSNLRLQIAEAAESILGDNVLAFQVGNEPDLYAA